MKTRISVFNLIVCAILGVAMSHPAEAQTTPTLDLPANGSINLSTPVTLIWSSVDTATSYELQVATDTAFTSIFIDQTLSTNSDTSYAAGGLSFGATYYWRVQAKYTADSSGFSNAYSFTTLPPIPAVPTLGSPADGSTNQPLSDLLSWSAASNATLYQLEVSTSSSFNSTIVNDSTISTSQTVGSLSSSTTYYWRVQAIDAAGSSGFSDAYSFTTLPPIPGVPTLLSPANGSTNQPLSDLLSWSPSSNASRYQVQVSTSSSFISSVINDSNVTSTSRSTGTLSAGTTYYWRVQAIDTAGSSGYSAAWSFTTLPPIPGVPLLASPANGLINQPLTETLSWDASSNATLYQIELSTSSSFSSTIINDSTLSSTSTITGVLSAGTTYYWRVQAINAAGSSGFSSAYSFTTLAPPAKPTLVSPANGSTNLTLPVTLTWNSVTNGASYEVQVAGNSSFALVLADTTMSSLPDTSYTVNGLSHSTTYYWRVQATNAAGTSGFSNASSFTTLAPPAPPSLISPANGSSNWPLSDTLSWNESPNATHYQVELSTSATFNTTIINDTTVTSTLRATGALLGGTSYYWRVQAINSAGQSGFSSTWSFTTLTPLTVPSVPSLISPTNASTGQSLNDTLNWNASQNASSYQLEVSTSISFGSTIINDTGITSTSMPTGTLSVGTTYYWRVQAINSIGPSGWSSVWSFATLTSPAPPSLLSPLNGSTDELLSDTLSWNTSPSANLYHVEVSTSSSFSSTIINDSTASTSQPVGNLSPSTTYYWRVQAINSAGPSGFSSVWGFATLAPPAPPSLLSPPNGSINQPLTDTLSWNASQNAIRYHVEVSISTNFIATTINDTAITSTSMSTGALSGGTSYYWRVQAINSVGSGAFSSAWSFTTLTPLAPPSVPSLLSPANGSVSQPLSDTLSWSASQNASRYQVEVSTSSNFNSTIINDTGITSTSMPTGALSGGAIYYWRVQAINSAGSSGFSPAWSFTTLIPLTAPSVPSLLSPVNGSAGQPLSDTLSWNASQNASRYQVEVSISSSFSSTLVNDSTVTSTSKITGTLSAGTTYFWRVQAINTAGSSGFSTVWSFTTLTPPAAPSLLSPLNSSSKRPLNDTLSWNASLSAVEYEVEVSTAVDFTPAIINDSTTSTSMITGALSGGTTYYWRVLAINTAGPSGWSDVWSFTTLTPLTAPSAPSLLAPPNGSTNLPLADTLSWSSLQDAQSYDLQLSTTASFASLVINDSGITTSSMQVGLLAVGTAYYWRVRAVNSVGVSAWSGAWTFTTAAPPATPTLLSPADSAANLPVSVTCKWDSVQNADMYHIQVATDSKFVAVVVNDSAITSDSVTIGSLTAGGTYFWRVRAKSPAGGWSSFTVPWTFSIYMPPSQPQFITTVDTVSFPTYSDASEFKPTDYRLIGMPGAGNMPIASVLHGISGRDWQAYWDNGAAADYMIQYESNGSDFNFTLGRGFWVIKNGPLIIDTTIQSARLDSTNSAAIPLHDGWNIITAPFAFSIPWSTIQSRDSVTELLYSFNGEFQSASSLGPNAGFYFFNSNNMATLEVPFDTSTKLSGVAAKGTFAAMAATLESLSNANWQVHIALSSNGFTDSLAWLGVSSQVKSDHNSLDVHKPRAIGFVPSVYFEHTEWDSNYGAFASEIHPVFSDSSMWILTVDAIPSRAAILRLSGLDRVPSDFDVYLLNTSTNKWIDMRSAASYTFVPSTSTTSFELLIGKDDLIKGEISNAVAFEVENNYPNPFNPSTTIPVYIAKEARIKVVVYDVIGRKVEEVYDGDASPGQHLFVWNGTGGSGKELSSGVYLYRVSTSTGYNAIRKMVFLK